MGYIGFGTCIAVIIPFAFLTFIQINLATLLILAEKQTCKYNNSVMNNHVYYKASDILKKVVNKKISMKQIMFNGGENNKNGQSSSNKSEAPTVNKEVYLLVNETLKYRPILKRIISHKDLNLGLDDENIDNEENNGDKKTSKNHDKQATKSKESRTKDSAIQNMFVLEVMLYELLFSNKKKIKCGGKIKKMLMSKYDMILKALADIVEEDKRNGVHTTDSSSKSLDDIQGDDNDEKNANVSIIAQRIASQNNYPRWLRVNESPGSSVDVIISKLLETGKFKKKDLKIDAHIPYVLKAPHGTDLHDHPFVKDGTIVLQDKSSCFPAHILFSIIQEKQLINIDIIDACAAPGNKTMQLASLLTNQYQNYKGKILAFDKAPKRLKLLQSRAQAAGFLFDGKTKNANKEIIHAKLQNFLEANPKNKEYSNVKAILLDPSCSGSGMVMRTNHENDDSGEADEDRLAQLSKFQKECLTHALSFPNVQCVTYSTCSIHEIENEEVVMHALRNNKDFELHPALPTWTRRGNYPFKSQNHGKITEQEAKCLIRVDSKQDETGGFFVALFVRKVQSSSASSKQGTSEEDTTATITKTTKTSSSSSKTPVDAMTMMRNQQMLKFKRKLQHLNSRQMHQQQQITQKQKKQKV